MVLVYPGLFGKPVILAAVECLLTGKKFLVPMLLDTGADETCFPAKFATFFGHNNHHPDVIKKTCRGVGGSSTAYIHSVRVSLLDPNKSTTTKGVIAWTARTRTAFFVEKLDCGLGLLGMDIISKWQSVTFKSRGNGTEIQIVI